MNILVLAESLDPTNGWGAYAYGLVKALRAQDVRLTVLTADASSEGPRLPRWNGGRLGWFVGEWYLALWLRFHRFDAIHVMTEPYARLYRSFRRIQFAVTVHGTYGDPAAHGRFSSVFREALLRARQVVAVSEYTRGRLPLAAQTKTAVIPNGVDLDIVNEPFDAVPAHGSPLILSVGAIKARKGFDRLVAGFAEFARTRPHAELVIIGRDLDFSARQGLESQVTSLGFEARVRFLGEVTRPALLGWYRACDVFALTPVSDGGFEGFGLVYLEANAFGKPCVGSRDSGARDAISDGESGYLVNADEPEDVARALERALALAPERVRVSLAGRTWDERAGEYVKIYRKCGSSGGSDNV